MTCRNLAQLCIGLALIVAPAAQGQVAYQYDGNNYTAIIDNTPPTGTTHSTAMAVTAEVVLGTALPANLPMQDVESDVLSYVFDDGANTLTSSDSTLLGGFKVATDSLGNISHWEVTAQSGPPLPISGGLGDQRVVITTTATASIAFDQGMLRECVALGTSGYCSQAFADLGRVFAQPGLWSLQQIDVALDIKPGSDPNSINPMSEGIIAVAIFGSESLDVTDIDGSTLAFGPNGAPLAHERGPHLEDDLGGPYDLDGDGVGDALVHFDTLESGIAWGDTEACVTGETLDGTPLVGCDDIRTQLSCGIGFELALVLPPLAWWYRRRRRVIR